MHVADDDAVAELVIAGIDDGLVEDMQLAVNQTFIMGGKTRGSDEMSSSGIRNAKKCIQNKERASPILSEEDHRMFLQLYQHVGQHTRKTLF